MIGASGPAEQKSSRNRMIAAESTSESIIYWQHSNNTRSNVGQPTETFKDFLDRESMVDGASEKIIAAASFVYDRPYEISVADVIREKREESLKAGETSTAASQPEQLQAESVEATRHQEAEQQRKASDEAKAREAVEQAHGAEVFDDILHFAKDKTYLYTDIKGYTPLGDAKLKDAGRTQIPQSILQEARKSPDYRQHLNEVVMFSGLTESDKRTVTRERQVKGKFGRSHTETYTDIEVVPDSKHPVLIHNEQTGQDEPSIRFRYNFKYSDYMSVDDRRALPPYQEFQGGRSGQTVQASIDLPESIANRLKTQIEQDPSSVRELVEKLFLNNHDGRITEDYWRKGGTSEHPIRPPYEKLPDDWTIALIDDAAKGSSQGYQITRLAASH
jgi:hypothetical protein